MNAFSLLQEQLPVGAGITSFFPLAMICSNVFRAIGYTHIAIYKPSVDNFEVFCCLKVFFFSFLPITVQGVCGAESMFYNVFAHWPGSVIDSRFFFFFNSQLWNTILILDAMYLEMLLMN